MSDVAISVKNLSKKYRLYDSPKHRLKEALHPFRKKYHHDFWALRDVSFEVKKGETVGIIGRNGSGKSTLLQVICGILQPSEGSIEVNGKISALLELGAGFNPEFTGRQNVYMNGALMGFTREAMDERFEAIAEFADIGEFIEQPVKTYSSGMYVRLAFAAAVNVDPEILVVDEALSVGDMFFQAKCMTKMRKMMDDGVTLLFVSHDTGAVKSLCDKAVLFENGAVKKIGLASEVGDYYIREYFIQNNEMLKKEYQNYYQIKEKSVEEDIKDNSDSFDIVVSKKEEVDLGAHVDRFGSGEARILDLKLLDRNHEISSSVALNEEFFLQASILFNKAVSYVCVGYQIKDSNGVPILGTTTTVEKVVIPPVSKNDVYIVELKTKNVLDTGNYSVLFAVEEIIDYNNKHIVLDAVDNGIVFKIISHSPKDKFWTKVHIPVDFLYCKMTDKECK